MGTLTSAALKVIWIVIKELLKAYGTQIALEWIAKNWPAFAMQLSRLVK